VIKGLRNDKLLAEVLNQDSLTIQKTLDIFYSGRQWTLFITWKCWKA